MTQQDKSELSLAIGIYGLKTIAEALDKNPETKKAACESIKSSLSEYDPSASEVKAGKMLKATTQITARLIKDKVWVVFSEGVTLTNTMYNNFIFSHPVSKKELGDSSVKIYRELLARSCDANERVQNKAEDTLEAMVINEKIRNAGSLHEELLQPLTV